MSYDLAVWEGERPADDEAAGKMFEEMFRRHLAVDVGVAPSPRIAAYVATLLERYPDFDADDLDSDDFEYEEAASLDFAFDEETPWAASPLIDEASGPIIFFPLVADRAGEVAEWAAKVAADHGLVCYDPQRRSTRP